MFLLLLEAGCGRGIVPPDTTDTTDCSAPITTEDWIPIAAAMECAYYTRCREDTHPGYGTSDECLAESEDNHQGFLSIEEKCVDPCLADEYQRLTESQDCADSTPLYSYAYVDCPVQ